MTTLALVGAHRAGKSTVARILADAHGYRVIEHSDVLWDVLVQIDPWVHAPGWAYSAPLPGPAAADWGRLSDIEAAYGRVVAKNRFPEVRRLLDEAGRGLRTYLGGEIIHQAVADRSAMFPKVVWPGARFPYETQDVTAVIAVVRPGCDQYYAPESEKAIERAADYRIDNSGSLDRLAAQVAGVLEWVEGRRRTRIVELTQTSPGGAL